MEFLHIRNHCHYRQQMTDTKYKDSDYCKLMAHKNLWKSIGLFEVAMMENNYTMANSQLSQETEPQDFKNGIICRLYPKSKLNLNTGICKELTTIKFLLDKAGESIILAVATGETET